MVDNTSVGSYTEPVKIVKGPDTSFQYAVHYGTDAVGSMKTKQEQNAYYAGAKTFALLLSAKIRQRQELNQFKQGDPEADQTSHLYNAGRTREDEFILNEIQRLRDDILTIIESANVPAVIPTVEETIELSTT